MITSAGKRILIFAACLFLAGSALAQSTEFILDETGDWAQGHTPEPGSDEAVMAEVSALLVADQPQAAFSMVESWISANKRSDSPYLPRAYLLRGDAWYELGNEFKALHDYERQVIQRFPQSEEFVLAIERELNIAIEYANGLRRKFFGLRLLGTGGIAEETLIRVQERLPGSELAERAAIELADYYYRQKRLELAAIAYDLYVLNYPNGPNIKRAMERRIRANVAQYKGPQYDGSTLLDAREQTRTFERLFPVDAEKTGLDERLIVRIDDALADQVLVNGQWYIKRGDMVSARFTFRRLLQKHPNTTAAVEALKIMEKHGWITEEVEVIGPVEEVEVEVEGPTDEETP